MRVDLEAGYPQLASIPRFQLATLHRRRLLSWGIGITLLGVIFFFGGLISVLFSRDRIWLPILINIGASLILLAAAFQSAYRVSAWRAETFSSHETTSTNDQETNLHTHADKANELEDEEKQPNVVSLFFSRFHKKRIQPIKNAIGEDVVWIIVIASIALISLDSVWRLDLPSLPTNKFAYLMAGIILLIAFVLLVGERYLANNKGEWPEAGNLAMQTRATIIVLAISALCLGYASSSAVWPFRLAVLIGLLPYLLGIELIIRAVLSVFSPSRPSLEPKLTAVSFLAELLRWPPKPLQLLQNSLQQNFGIDLRQVWAFRFIRRAFFPVIALIALTGWSLTSVYEIPINGRGIYEKFGKPVAVISSGLHLGLPWPLGRVITVENGVVHELATTSSDNVKDELAPAEGPAPVGANRLWDATHNSEKSQIIASSHNNKQSFQIVDMDVRFVYRIGLNDQDALKATYNTADLTTLIRRTASRVLVHDFAGRTLDDLLSEQRTALAQDINSAVQRDLDNLNSGVELLATVVEAIHPPAKAANAYHKVQAAQIKVKALIAREKGKAAELSNDAQQQASLIKNQAQANVRDTLGQAQAAQIKFNAENTAANTAGETFLKEQYYRLLSDNMSKVNSLIIDDKIASGHAPTIDFRSFVAPVDSTNKAKTN
ncbi:protease modulator HflK [Marinomonas sp.]|uniref:protease modulator HflK n=1 Tax=Marinomonas sp. TaxID=1904862 RepID=UPI003BA893E2